MRIHACMRRRIHAWHAIARKSSMSRLFYSKYTKVLTLQIFFCIRAGLRSRSKGRGKSVNLSQQGTVRVNGMGGGGGSPVRDKSHAESSKPKPAVLSRQEAMSTAMNKKWKAVATFVVGVTLWHPIADVLGFLS